MLDLIEKSDLEGVRDLLSANPALANKGVPLCETNLKLAHPLHRICDAVHAGKIEENEAVLIAEILFEFGANVDGNGFVEKEDTPLIAAASLCAEKVGMLYVERGADIHHRGCHGGTALHWAAWCGLDRLVLRLLKEKPEINQLCIDHRATPVFWSVHGLKNGPVKNQVECARVLLKAGADASIPNVDGDSILSMLDETDSELFEILNLKK